MFYIPQLDEQHSILCKTLWHMVKHRIEVTSHAWEHQEHQELYIPVNLEVKSF